MKFYDFHCYFIHFILKWLINESDVINMDNNQKQYITSHNNARSIINKVERDDIIEALLENYIETRLK